MNKYLTLIGALSAVAFAIAPLVTSLHPTAGAVISIAGVALATFGPALKGPRGFKRKARGGALSSKVIAPLLALAVLPLALLTTGCSENELRRAAQTSNTVSTGLSSGVEVKRGVRQAGLIDDQAEREITRAMLDVTRAAREFNDQALSQKVFTQDTRAKLLQLSRNLSSAAQRLASNGTLHIKNPQALQRFTLTLTSINAALPILERFLQRDVAPEGASITEDIRRSFERSNETLKECETNLLADLERLTPQTGRALPQEKHIG